jgi:integrase
LSDDELRALWTALESEPLKIAAPIRLALLTAQRRGEVLGLPWAELDLERGVWTLAAARAKNGKEHRIPLATAAVVLLRELLPTAGSSPFVFPGSQPKRPVVNPQKWIARIRARAAIDDFHFHDLRRSAASGMTALGVSRLTVSKLLNHAEGGVTWIYDRHNYDAEKRAAIEKWAQHLERLVSPSVQGFALTQEQSQPLVGAL